VAANAGAAASIEIAMLAAITKSLLAPRILRIGRSQRRQQSPLCRSQQVTAAWDRLAAMIVSILIRRLREGKSYEDFREAWLPEKGFGWPTRVITAQRMDDPREIVTIGFSDIEPEKAKALLDQVGIDQSGVERGEAAAERPEGDEHLADVADVQLARRSRIHEVIEPGVTRTFYIQVADDDLT
jgi:hypothetical protein